VTDLVVAWRWLGLEGVVPPPVGAFARGPGAWWHCGRGVVRWARQRARAQCSPSDVGDDQGVGGPADGDDAAMVQPMMVRADQHEVVEFGAAAVFPMPNVMSVQTPGGPATGNRAGGMAVLESTT
jgi:hypothetical protein